MFLDIFIAVLKLLIDAGSLILFGCKYFPDETAINKKMDSGIDFESPSTLEWNRTNVIHESSIFRHRHYYDNRSAITATGSATGVSNPALANGSNYNAYAVAAQSPPQYFGAEEQHYDAMQRKIHAPGPPMMHPYYPQPQVSHWQAQNSAAEDSINQHEQAMLASSLPRPIASGVAVRSTRNPTVTNSNSTHGSSDTVELANDVQTHDKSTWRNDITVSGSEFSGSNSPMSAASTVASKPRVFHDRSKSLDLKASAFSSRSRKKGLRHSKPIVQLDRLSLLNKLSAEEQEERRHSRSNSEDLSTLNRFTRRRNSSSSDVTPEQSPRIDQESSSMDKLRRNSASFPTIALADLSLLHMIGGGGFGQVWKGTWGGTPVAVKLLSNICQFSTMPNDLFSSFEEEVSILSQLRHPNICLFLGVCMEPPHRAIVTELVARGSLWDALRVPNLFHHNGNNDESKMMSMGSAVESERYWLPWPMQTVKRVLEGTCRGLIYLHSHTPPIIHRDLKSANLLLDETFNVKICDFGLARLRDYTTVLTANVGTIQWMAPEVLTGSEYNESADIYSVGIVMWEMFTGVCPYEGMKQVEVALSVVQRNLRPIIPTSCTVAQANLMRRCWATDPTHRLTAHQLLQEIDSAFRM